MNKKSNLSAIAHSKKTWLIASSVLLSAGFGEAVVAQAADAPASQRKVDERNGLQASSSDFSSALTPVSGATQQDAPVVAEPQSEVRTEDQENVISNDPSNVPKSRQTRSLFEWLFGRFPRDDDKVGKKEWDRAIEAMRQTIGLKDYRWKELKLRENPYEDKAMKGLLRPLFQHYELAIRRTNTRKELRSTLDRALHAIAKILASYDKSVIQPEDLEKAKATLTQEANDRKAIFAAIPHVDPNSLAMQKARIDERLVSGLENLDNATIQSELKNYLDQAIASIHDVKSPEISVEFEPVEKEDQQAAARQITESAKEKKQAFEALEHRQPESVKQQSAMVDHIVDEALQAIFNTTMKSELDKVLQDNLQKINRVADPEMDAAYGEATPESRQEAIDRLNQKALDKKNEFDNLDGTNPDSLKAQHQVIDNILANALKQVALAKTGAELEKAYRDGLQQLASVPEPEVLEGNKAASAEDLEKATNKLYELKNGREKEFKAVPHVDEESLNEQTALLNKMLAIGVNKLNEAKSRDQLASALKEAKGLLYNVAKPKVSYDYQVATTAEKQATLKRLTDAAESKKDGFARLENADPKSVEEQRVLVDYQLQLAKERIDGVTYHKDLSAVYHDALKAIADVSDPALQKRLQNASQEDKDKAKQTLQEAGQKKQAGFEAIPHVDDYSLNAQKREVQNQVDIALKAVDEVKTNGQLDAVLKHGLLAIDQVSVPVLSDLFRDADDAYKQAAKDKLNEFLAMKQRDFEGIAHVDKASLKEQLQGLNDVSNDAIKQIQDAKTRGDVNQAESAGERQLAAVTRPIVQEEYLPVTKTNKQVASSLLEQLAKEKKTSFEQIVHVDSLSLDKQKALIDEKLSAAKDAIEKASIQSELKQAVKEGLSAISAVADPQLEKAYQKADPASKKEAEDRFKQAANDKKKDFDAIPGVDSASADEQKKAVDDLFDKAKKQMKDAKDNGDLNKAFRDALEALEHINDPKVKEALLPAEAADTAAADKKLDDEAAAKKNSFAAIEHVDKTSLDNQNKMVDDAVNKAKKAIHDAKTKGDVAKALADGIDSIDAVSDPVLEPSFQKLSQKDKDLALKTIYNAVDKKRNAFNSIEHVDPKSLDEQLKKLSRVEKNAAEGIQLAATKGELDQFMNLALDNITSIAKPALSWNYQPASDYDRDHAHYLIEQAATEKKGDFDRLPNRDAKSLKEQKQKVDDLVKNSEKAVADAPNNLTLNQVTNDIIKAIRAVEKPAEGVNPNALTDGQRAEAIKRLQAKAEAKKGEFNAIPHVDQESLQRQLAMVNIALSDGVFHVKMAFEKEDLTKAIATAEAEIQAVEKPEFEFDYRPVDDVMFEKSKNVLFNYAEKRKSRFDALPNVDAQSLAIQKSKIDVLYEQGVNAMHQAQVHHDLKSALHAAMEKIRLVASPKQAANLSEDAIRQAQNEVMDAAATRESQMKAIKNVDQYSLTAQMENVQNIAIHGVASLSFIHDAGELQRTKNMILEMIVMVADPRRIEVTDEAREAAKKTVDDATKKKHKAIDAVVNPNDNEKKEIEQDVDDRAKKGKKDIDNAKTEKDLNKATTDTVDDINDIPLPMAGDKTPSGDNNVDPKDDGTANKDLDGNDADNPNGGDDNKSDSDKNDGGANKPDNGNTSDDANKGNAGKKDGEGNGANGADAVKPAADANNDGNNASNGGADAAAGLHSNDSANAKNGADAVKPAAEGNVTPMAYTPAKEANAQADSQKKNELPETGKKADGKSSIFGLAGLSITSGLAFMTSKKKGGLN